MYMMDLLRKLFSYDEKSNEPEYKEIDSVPQKFDGVYFNPNVDEYGDTYTLSFFNYDKETTGAKLIENTKIGIKFHIAFFKPNDKGIPVFSDSFEAILNDPIQYINSLVGSDLAGCICRKTEKSYIWFEKYLNYVTGDEYQKRMLEACKSIADN